MDEVRGSKVADGSRVNVSGARWYRIYYRNGVWHVDEGTPATDRICFKVLISVIQPVSTEDNLTDEWWFTACGVLREQKDNKGRKVITITRR